MNPAWTVLNLRSYLSACDWTIFKNWVSKMDKAAVNQLTAVKYFIISCVFPP